MESFYSRNAIIAIWLLVGQISAQIQPNSNDELKKTLYEACSGKYPITDEMKENVKKYILSEDHNFKCYLMCVFDTFSLIDADGVIDGQTWISIVPEYKKSVITKAVTACLPSDAGKPDPCEAAFSFLSCGIKAVPELAELAPL